MSELLTLLGSKAQRGSKPRCHWMTHGMRSEVAARLTRLIAPWGRVTADDRWMPDGFDQREEAELHKAKSLLDPQTRPAIKSWWFKVVAGRQTGPSFDIASTCAIRVEATGTQRKGLLLVEAKAHVDELKKEECGKRLRLSASNNERANDEHIRDAIAGANGPLETATGVKWALSHSSNYQMSNRIASASKLNELGVSVILVYLGLLRANEMEDISAPIQSSDEWKRLVENHHRALFPASVWNRAHSVHGQWFVPLIRSVEIPYDRPVGEFVVDADN